MKKDAVISECGLYRPWLLRVWDDTLPRMGFIQLNPSEADASIDDPTLRRDMYFARREGFGGVELTNLYDFRAKDPKDLARAASPVSGACDEHICRMLSRCAKTVAGYGAHPLAVKREGELLDMLDARDVLWCLGLTKGGMPRHPLYLRNDTPLQIYATYSE